MLPNQAFCEDQTLPTSVVLSIYGAKIKRQKRCKQAVESIPGQMEHREHLSQQI